MNDGGVHVGGLDAAQVVVDGQHKAGRHLRVALRLARVHQAGAVGHETQPAQQVVHGVHDLGVAFGVHPAPLTLDVYDAAHDAAKELVHVLNGVVDAVLQEVALP